MSLLLDALKKAALEKQRRENPSVGNQPVPVEMPVAPQAVETIPEHVSKTNVGEYLGEITLEAQALPATQSPANNPIDADAAAATTDIAESHEELTFDINEIDHAYLQPQTMVVTEEPPAELTLVSTVTAPQVAEYSSPPAEKSQPAEAPNEPKEHIAQKAPTAPLAAPVVAATPVDTARAIQPDSAPKSDHTAQASPQPTERAVETFNDESGKTALAQLLSRSQQAANKARKRILWMYGALTVTALSIVLAYYFLLGDSSSMLVAPIPPRAAPVTISPEVTTENTSPSTATPTVTDAKETESTAGEITAETNDYKPLPPVRNEQRQTQTQRTSPSQSPERNEATQVSLPPNVVPKEAFISHRIDTEDLLNKLIEQGYNAYQQGDYISATKAYKDALEQDPFNRDALLGAAAVAVREGRLNEALNYYQQQLTRDPKDEYAQAGIISLNTGGEANPLLESEVTRLLHEHPNAAHLHFLKGLLYAGQQQWAAAQLAFFEAWQRDNKNPDIAFNMAVTLDHLAQAKEATHFYQLALQLGKSHSASFSKDAVQQRIDELGSTKP